MTITINELRSLIDERPDEGIYRVHRRMFIDEDVFELEMRHIFEGSWVFVAHESQILNPHDFVTSFIGRHAVIINRSATGDINGFINVCQHRGTVVERMSRGNRKVFMCPFHGWCYKSSGELVDCGDSEPNTYSDKFDKSALGLKPLARIASYRGFIFASLNADVPTLDDHLGQAAQCIDHIVDQHPEGAIEVIPGQQSYTFDGNWKLQAENGVDGYHVDTIHANYIETVTRRQKLLAGKDPVKAADVSGIDQFPGGYFAFENGHVLLWNEWPNPQVRPAWPQLDAYTKRFGADKAAWMTSYLRNLLIYPNVFIMDQMSTQIRIFRPLAVDKTEVRTMCFAPVDEAAGARSRRIRQYEDFFNASGMATPDDLAAFNASQVGFTANSAEWSDVSRGAINLIEGADEQADKLGLKPQYSGSQLQDEGIYLNEHRRWLQLLSAGIERDEANEASRNVA
ncbi:MAG: SRPBCC family protein [Gammaproteobacteria bacterium]|jgi:benzoate/toluate 1,2-dioxygenase alpha subunit